jgi:nitrate reductase NapE
LHVWEDDVEEEIVPHRLIDFRKRRLRELAAFFVLAFGIWPIVAVGVVGGYGFLVWFYQILNGPPGPHGG